MRLNALDKLKVPHPLFAGSVDRWLVFLSRLLASAKAGNVEHAKALWPEMKAEMERTSTGDRE